MNLVLTRFFLRLPRRDSALKNTLTSKGANGNDFSKVIRLEKHTYLFISKVWYFFYDLCERQNDIDYCLQVALDQSKKIKVYFSMFQCKFRRVLGLINCCQWIKVKGILVSTFWMSKIWMEIENLIYISFLKKKCNNILFCLFFKYSKFIDFSHFFQKDTKTFKEKEILNNIYKLLVY